MNRNSLGIYFSFTMGIGISFLILTTGCGKENSHYGISAVKANTQDPSSADSTSMSAGSLPLDGSSDLDDSSDLDGSSNSCGCSAPGIKKVYVCHNQKTLCVNVNGLHGHLQHAGDIEGKCNIDR